MLTLYRFMTSLSAPVLRLLLHRRITQGKEDKARLAERQGRAGAARPPGPLIWCHAASVGEALSALILIKALREQNPALKILITSGTVTSATLMQKHLPEGVIHQYAPLDHPGWVAAFIKHWRPGLALWMESELWPNMLSALNRRNIPVVLVNARMSPRSCKKWMLARPLAKEILSKIGLILAQTEDDARRYRDLGAEPGALHVTDNLKYSAAPLPCNAEDLAALEKAITGAGKRRPLWLYASTHEGEEDLACRVHLALKQDLPGLLTIIAPRHPQRGSKIGEICTGHMLKCSRRSDGSDGGILPDPEDDIYIADTLGELGLFYRLAPLAVIGRSFSLDGGGGHNPVEAAQLNCVVLHGPNVQYQQQIYQDMHEAGAALAVSSPQDLEARVRRLLQTPQEFEDLQEKGQAFAARKSGTVKRVMEILTPCFSNLTDTTENAEKTGKTGKTRKKSAEKETGEETQKCA